MEKPNFQWFDFDNMVGLIISNTKGEVFTCTVADFRKQVEPSKELANAVIKVERMPKVGSAVEVVNRLD